MSPWIPTLGIIISPTNKLWNIEVGDERCWFSVRSVFMMNKLRECNNLWSCASDVNYLVVHSHDGSL